MTMKPPFDGPGRRVPMARRIADHDWAATPVGPPDRWPSELIVALRIMLRSAAPVAIHWGTHAIVFHNDPWRDRIGGGDDDGLGRPGHLASPRSWEALAPLFERVRESRFGQLCETAQFARKEDLERASFRLSADPIPLEDGAVGGIMTTAFEKASGEKAETDDEFDGDDRDRAALRETENRLKTLIEGIPQLVWSSHEGGMWNWSSPQWQEFTGQTHEESLGMGWLDALHPEDRDAVRGFWRKAGLTGQLEMKGRIRHAATGRYRWFQTRATPVLSETGVIAEWLGTSTDIHDLHELKERQGAMVHELQHRTRNLISVVVSLSREMSRRAESVREFGVRFEDRLFALSRVQGLLSHLSAGERVELHDLLRAEFAALGVPDGKVTLEGPGDIPLRSASVQTFAMAVHELALNAAEYGAFAMPAGHLTVRWSLARGRDGGTRLRIVWQESGVDTARSPMGPGGYGRALIECALPYQLDAETCYEMGADGVRCIIEIPSPVTADGGKS